MTPLALPALRFPARAGLRAVLAGALLAGAGLTHGCASAGTPSTRYPRRAPGCDVAVYHTAVPEVATWDDLGVAEATCHIGGPLAECLRLLKADACRLGGDILYNVPRKPFRPRDQLMQLRGQVAHTRGPGATGGEHGAHEDENSRQTDDGAPPPATPEEAGGPIVPLPSGERTVGPGADPVIPPAPPDKAPQP
jgi:hypothetical protein